MDETIPRKGGHRGQAERNGGGKTFQSCLLSLMSSEGLIQLTDQERDNLGDTHRLYTPPTYCPSWLTDAHRASGSG